jgi:tight adherence protein B
VLGFDALGTLIGDPYGRAAGIAGLLLLALGALWAHRLSGRAEPRRLAPGFSLELVAIAVRGGGALEQACRSVESECERHSLTFEREAVEDCLRLADRAGAPVAGLLRAEAALLRSVVGAEDRTRAAALGVTLLLPLGVCVLPAFMLLAIAPTLLAVMASTMAGL